MTTVRYMMNGGVRCRVLPGTGGGSVPVNLTLPVITGFAGNPVVLDTVTVTPGTYTNTPTSYSYVWKRGATTVQTGGTSYTMVVGDAASGLTCIETPHNAAGAGLPATSAATPVVLNVFTPSYWKQWSNGPSPTGDRTMWPIAIWEADDSLGSAYAALGIFVGIQNDPGFGYAQAWDGPPGTSTGAVGGGPPGGRFDLDPPYTINGNATYISDEVDMNQVDFPTNNEQTAPYYTTLAAAIKAADTTRPTYANFGKVFAEPGWSGTSLTAQSPAATSADTMRAQYVENVDILSSDYYGYTDPFDAYTQLTPAKQYYGAWTYGQAVASMKGVSGAGAKPVLVFVETGRPFNNGNNSGITAAQVVFAAWNGVMWGANGVIYFDHDFAAPTSNAGLVSGGPEVTTVAPTVSALNATFTALAGWLNAPSQSGVSVSSTGSIPITTMLKTYNGHTYLFAMADGNASHLDSGSTTGTFTIPTGFGSSAVVYTESRSVTITSNSFVDTFTAYQVHIYELS